MSKQKAKNINSFLKGSSGICPKIGCYLVTSVTLTTKIGENFSRVNFAKSRLFQDEAHQFTRSREIHHSDQIQQVTPLLHGPLWLVSRALVVLERAFFRGRNSEAILLKLSLHFQRRRSDFLLGEGSFSKCVVLHQRRKAGNLRKTRTQRL